MMRDIVPLKEGSGTTGAPTRRGLLDGNRIGRRKGVLEGFVECLFLVPTLVAIAIVLMRFAFRIGNHFRFSDRAAKDFRGYDTNFGALIVKRYPFALSGCRKCSHGATSIGSFSYHGRGWKLLRQHRCWSSITATRCFTAFCTFSNAHTLIWRTRSRETPNSSASSLSVIGSSASRRASNMRRSRSLSAESAEASALWRFSNSSLAASVVSWSACSSTNRSSHSLELPSSRIGALSEESPPSRRFMWITSVWVTPSCRAMIFTWSGRMSPSSSAVILFLALRRLKNSFFWFTVVPIFTSDHERRMYSWIAALIHHVA